MTTAYSAFGAALAAVFPDAACRTELTEGLPAGKSTPAAALARAGAGYGHDDLAAVDQNGCVRVMARPPRLRADVATAYALPAALAGSVVTNPVSVAAVLVLAYRPGPALELRPLDQGVAAIHLVANCLNARHDPDLALRHAAAAVRGAWCGEGLRGNAVEAAAEILDRIDSHCGDAP